MNFSISLKDSNHHKNNLLDLFSKYKIKNAAFKINCPQDHLLKDTLASTIPISSTKFNFFTDIFKDHHHHPQVIACQYSTRFHKLQIQSKDDSDETQSTLKITDPMILYFIREIVGEFQLINLAKRFSLKVEFTTEMAIFTGKREIINEICKDINEIYYDQVSSIDDKRAFCLEKMNRIISLNRKYSVKILKLPPQFIIYGQSKKDIQKYKNKLTKVIEKIVLVEFTKPFLSKSQERIIFQSLFSQSSFKLASKDEVGILDHPSLDHVSLFLSLQRPKQEFDELCAKLKILLESFTLFSCPEKLFSSSLSNLTDSCQNKPVRYFSHNDNQYCVCQNQDIQEFLQDEGKNSSQKIPFSAILSFNLTPSISSINLSLVPQKGHFTLKDIFTELDLAKFKTLERNLSSIQGQENSSKYQLLKSFLEKFHNLSRHSEQWNHFKQNYHLFTYSAQTLLEYFQFISNKNCPQISHILSPADSEYLTILQRKYLSSYSFAWFDVFSWNARGIKSNPQKMRFLQIEKSAIQFIQEIWSPSQQQLAQFKNSKFIKRQNRQGGGTLTNLQKKNLKFIEEHPISEDMILCKILINKTTVIWMVSIYLNQGLAQQLSELFETIKKIIPKYEWRFILMAGDWNIDLLKESLQKTLLKRFCSELDLRIHSPRNPSRCGASLDYVVVGNSIDVGDLKTMESPSDHKALCFRVRVPNF